jgi:hypothetical protein
MKTLILLSFISLLLTPCLVNSQSAYTREFYKKYKRTEGTTKMVIPGFVIKGGTWIARAFMKDEEEKLMMKMLGKFGRLRLMNIEDTNPVEQDDVTRLMKSVRNHSYDDLISVNSEGERVHIMAKSGKNKIKGFFILVSSEDSFTLVSIKGSLNIKHLNELLKTVLKEEKIMDKVPEVIRA